MPGPLQSPTRYRSRASTHTVFTIDHAVDARAVTVAYAVPQPTVTVIRMLVDADPVAVTYAVPAATVKHTQVVDADPVTVSYAVPAAAVTHTAADPLTLADWDDTGLVADFAALIEVSGTTTLYADADRGGTDTPLDGELRIDDATDISQFRWDGTRFIWNDNDSPDATNLETYYQPGGDGNDQTIYLVAGTAAAHTTESLRRSDLLPRQYGGWRQQHQMGWRHSAPGGSHGAARRAGRRGPDRPRIRSAGSSGHGQRRPGDGGLRGPATLRPSHAQSGRRPRCGGVRGASAERHAHGQNLRPRRGRRVCCRRLRTCRRPPSRTPQWLAPTTPGMPAPSPSPTLFHSRGREAHARRQRRSRVGGLRGPGCRREAYPA